MSFYSNPQTFRESRRVTTADQLASDTPAIFQPSFMAHNTFVAVDLMENAGDEFTLIEVESSSTHWEEHISDAAVQKYVPSESNSIHTRSTNA